MNPDGKQPRRLTNSAVGDIFPDWSPDSQKLIWLITNPGNIAVMNADGQNPMNLSDDNKSERGFWSPDGGKIALLTQRDGNREIYVMDADGANQTNLSNHKSEDTSPTWAPDSETVAFVSDRDGNREIYIADAAGKGLLRNLTNHPSDDSNPAWSPVKSLGVALKLKQSVTWGWLKQPKHNGANDTSNPNRRED